jgi:hypothetical protein
VDDQRYMLNSPGVIGEVIDGEVMIINLVSGTYYNLTGTGAAAWPLLAAGLPVNAIVDYVAEACAVSPEAIARDMAVFINGLVAEAILRAAEPGAAPAAIAQPLGAAPYSGFALHRYDDMRALLVVDPVHEVGDFGWPPAPEPPRTPQ